MVSEGLFSVKKKSHQFSGIANKVVHGISWKNEISNFWSEMVTLHVSETRIFYTTGVFLDFILSFSSG